MCCSDCFSDAGTIGPVEDATKESSEGMPVSRRKPNCITGSLASSPRVARCW